jgi:translation initiation factor 2 beta subunit (eIF-2beta)/eIF-5
MLKDALNELLEKKYSCRFNTVFNTIDSESQEVLVSLMKNKEIPSRSIHSVLI